MQKAVTIEYSDDHKPIRIDSIVVSTQHDDFGSEEEMLNKIREDIKNILVPRVVAQQTEEIKALFNDQIKYHINPTGKFVIGGPHGDTGLTGRKKSSLIPTEERSSRWWCFLWKKILLKWTEVRLTQQDILLRT